MGGENIPAHPELLDELASQFADHDFELKFLIRAITATRAYGLTSALDRPEPTPPYLFSAMPVRGLSAGQLFSSLAQATGFRDGPDLYGMDAGGARGPVPRPLRQPRREADRGPDLDPPGPHADERPDRRRGHQPRDRRHPRRRRRGPLSRHRRPGRGTLPRRPDPSPQARRIGLAGRLRREGRPRPKAARRPSPTSSGRSSTAPSSSTIIDMAETMVESEDPLPRSHVRSRSERRGRGAAMDSIGSRCPAFDPPTVDAAGLGRRHRRVGLGLDRDPGGRGRRRPEAAEVVHPPLDDRRAEPDRHLRPQAGPRERRAVQGDRDGRPWRPDLRAPAEARRAR